MSKKNLLAATILFLGLMVPVQATLVGYWSLDDGSGSTVTDHSGFGHDAVINPEDESAVSWSDTGYQGGCLSFNDAFAGTTRIDAPMPTGLLNMSQASIAFWMKMPVAHQPWGVIVDLIGASTDYSLEATDNAIVYFYNPWFGDDSSPLNDDQWHHFVLTAGAQLTMYIDGQQAATTAGNLSDDIVTVRIGGPRQYQSVWARYIGLLDEVAVYNETLDADAVMDLYLHGLGANPTATKPSPGNGETDVAPYATLSWTPVDSAQTRNVYFSTQREDVNNASAASLVGQNQTATSYTPPNDLELGQTYYWRVDEVNGAPDYTVFPGNVWNFTVEPVAFVMDSNHITATASSMVEGSGPEKTIDGSGLDDAGLHSLQSTDMWISDTQEPNSAWIQYDFDKPYVLHEIWIWNSNQNMEQLLGFGFKDTLIETSMDGQNWTVLSNDTLIAQGSGKQPIGISTKVDCHDRWVQHVRLTALSNWSISDQIQQYSLSEVQFTWVPTAARLPQPADGATDVKLTEDLQWRPGRRAVSHDLYFGTEAQAVTDGTVTPQNMTGPEVPLSSLGVEYDRTYYWRVDEVNEAAEQPRYEGNLWSFSTAGYRSVDEFESYNDNDNLIYDAWSDGYGDNTNGSQVGHLSAPFAEQTTVFSGKQSMPYFYDNTGGITSTATLTLGGQDWTVGGIHSLTLYFLGDRTNTGGQLFVEVNGKQVTNPASLSLGLWKQWNIDLTALGIDLTNVKTLTIGVSGSGKGVLYIDAIRLYRVAPPIAPVTDPGTTDLVAHWALDDGSGSTAIDSAGGHNGTLMGSPLWTNGFQGGALQLNGVNDYVDCGADAAFDITDVITLSAWVNTADAGNGEHNPFVGKGDTSYAIKHGNSNDLEFYVYENGSWYTASYNVTSAFNNTWHHVTGTFDGNQVKLYIDGQLRATQAHVGGISTNSFAVNLGRNSEHTDRLYDGLIDDVRVYHRVLSEGEIRYLAGDQ